MEEFKPFYRRNLPHFQINGGTYFVTTRLYGSLPKDVTSKLKNENDDIINQIKLSDKSPTEIELLIDEQHRRYFGKFDKLLDYAANDVHWLKIPEIAQIVADAIHYRDEKQYELICYTIMSNHLHLVFTVLDENINLYTILQRLKQYTASQANKVLGKKNEFWQEESYDRVVRNGDELKRIISYVLNNSVKIGLVKDWRDYPYSYVNENFM
jgi:putative transposase